MTYSLRGYADTLHAKLSHLVGPAAPDARPRIGGSDPVYRTRIGADSLLVRASAPLAAEAAFAGLARQSTLAASGKLAWSAREGFELLAEVPRQENLRDAEEEVRNALCEAQAWLANGVNGSTNGTLPPSSSLIEILNGAGCFVRSAAADGCCADVNLGGSVYRVLVGEHSHARVRLSFPATTVRVEDERAQQATALFALEANHRLRLARVSVTPLASDRARVVWDMVVNGGPCLTRRLPDALEALVVARDETTRALRALRNRDVADVYLASARARQRAVQKNRQAE